MIYYLDTSALVKRYYTEKGSAWIQTLFHPDHLLVVSKVAYAELLTALARKGGTGRLARQTSPGL